MRRGVDQQVPHHPDVVHAAVHLDRVVVGVGDVVAVDVDGVRPAVPELARRIAGALDRMRAVGMAVHLGVDAVVKVRDVVVRDDVAGAVEPNRRVRLHHRRELLPLDVLELLPERAGPPGQVARIVPADELAVGDVEVARRRGVGEHAHAHVLEAAPLHGQPLRAGDGLRARPDRDVGVPERDPLEVVVVGGLDVEQVEVAAAVEDHLAVARRLDHDRLLRACRRPSGNTFLRTSSWR